mmetsp:Transcript_26126/g.25985  ORF Transcript_26126/g.25985 Transcript_26126/m.25985 type:complete len:227 (+) Transcript_26126:891-1571(+)
MNDQKTNPKIVDLVNAESPKKYRVNTDNSINLTEKDDDESDHIMKPMSKTLKGEDLNMMSPHKKSHESPRKSHRSSKKSRKSSKRKEIAKGARKTSIAETSDEESEESEDEDEAEESEEESEEDSSVSQTNTTETETETETVTESEQTETSEATSVHPYEEEKNNFGKAIPFDKSIKLKDYEMKAQSDSKLKMNDPVQKKRDISKTSPKCKKQTSPKKQASPHIQK